MRRAIASLLLLVGGALVTAQLTLPGMIQRRLQASIDARDDVRGAVEDIRLCLPCGSYTLVGPAFEIRDGEDWRPLLEAREVVVALLPASLLAGRPAGAVHLDQPVLGVRPGGPEGSQDTALGLPWSEIGDALLPVPIDRLVARDGRIELSNPALQPPVRWVVSDVDLVSVNLTRRGGAPTEIEADGRIDESGRIRVHVRLPSGEDRFTLDGTMRSVPVTTFNDYLRNAFAVDVGEGTLDAHLALERVRGKDVRGSLDCRVKSLDVVELGEVSEKSPLNLLWQTLAAGSLAVASSDQGLELQFEIAETLAPRLDAWSVLGLVVRRSVLKLLSSPVDAMRWLGERLVPGLAE